MFNDTYYIRSFVSTVLLLGALFTLLLYYIYSTGVYGLITVAAVLLLLLGYFYGWHSRLSASRGHAKGCVEQNGPALKESTGAKVKV